MGEDDERNDEKEAEGEGNSLGRVFALSDGVFAIAMTLLALDLKVPDLGDHPSSHALGRALADNSSSYWSFLLSFYIIALYWVRHRQVMRSVVVVHPALIRDTLALLLIVAAMPFPASLLGQYGGTPLALAIYGGTNAAAILVLMALDRDVRRYELTAPGSTHADDYSRQWQSWLTLGVFLICIPGAYVLGRHGPWLLVLLAVPDRIVGFGFHGLIGRLTRSGQARRARP
jgi:uncharacterized membrane protein